uniref:Uncharacterized protein n=2 Tax=Craspedostauros australis TaxID=1486917 RepID=A0A7R9ZSG4_9STRA
MVLIIMSLDVIKFGRCSVARNGGMTVAAFMQQQVPRHAICNGIGRVQRAANVKLSLTNARSNDGDDGSGTGTHAAMHTRSNPLSNPLCINEEARRGTSIRRQDESMSRRRSMLVAPLALAGMMTVSSWSTPQSANAAMKNTQTVFKVGTQLTLPEAKDRFREGRKSMQYLLDNYDEVCEGGGDNVRRYLGTVGTSSGMFGISKVMKTLMEEADDIVEYTETMAEIEKCVQQADGSAYMAIFVTTSTSYTPPAKYFGDAKIEIKRGIKAMDDLAKLINLEL